METSLPSMLSDKQPAEALFTNYRQTANQALDALGARDVLERQTTILIKPNLVTADSHPVTTSPECCAAIIDYIRACSNAAIVIAEGCGDACCETTEIFTALGYDRLAAEYGINLIDLNHLPLVRCTDQRCTLFPEILLPEIAFSHFIVSVPVLKAHSLATLTGTLKNMMGFAPPAHYSGRCGTWKKAAFHAHLHQAITELNRYRTPDLTVLDASIGLAEHHLGGAWCKPPVNRIIAGFDPLSVDRKAAGLLGLDWRTIGHLCPSE